MSNEINNVEIAGLDQDVFFESGDFNNGHWTNHLTADLEELAAGNLDKVFSVDSKHDTYGTSFRIYHGIDVEAKLPNGVTREAIQEFCNNLVTKTELVEGFRVEWDGNNHVARWYDADGDRVGGWEHPGDYWSGQFRVDAADLTAVEVYDLSDGDNIDYVMDAIGTDHADEAAVLTALEENYDSEQSSEYHFVGHAGAAEKIWEKIQEQRADDEE